MPYCTLTDIQKKISDPPLIQLTDDDNTGTINTGNVDAAIEEADELIDSYIGKVKAVPLVPVPGIVKNLSVNMAIWNLHVRRSVVDPTREKAYDAAVKTLKLIAEGTVTLGEEEAVLPDETTEGGPQSSTDESDRTFTDDSLSGF